eukprot:1161122-Pelagomonas_calceolata.AAC.5
MLYERICRRPAHREAARRAYQRKVELGWLAAPGVPGPNAHRAGGPPFRPLKRTQAAEARARAEAEAAAKREWGGEHEVLLAAVEGETPVWLRLTNSYVLAPVCKTHVLVACPPCCENTAFNPHREIEFPATRTENSQHALFLIKSTLLWPLSTASELLPSAHPSA